MSMYLCYVLFKFNNACNVVLSDTSFDEFLNVAIIPF